MKRECGNNLESGVSKVTYLEKALQDGYAEIVDDGKKQRIIYKAIDHSERYGGQELKDKLIALLP